MEKKSLSKRVDRRRLFQRLNNREKSLAVVFLSALLVGTWLPQRIIVSTSPSLSHRIFFLTNAKNNVRAGDYLVFRHKTNIKSFVQQGLNKDNDRFIKEVGCGPGKELSKDADNYFFCNGLLLGKALHRDSKGRLLPQFDFIGLVPDNHFFMVGSNPRSFDSRYFGFIHADEIIYKAFPLW